MTKKLDKLVSQIDKLPNLFNVGVLVLKKMEDPETQAKDLAKFISIDQALTTQILKVCNSAQYGFSRKISNLQEAITKLGFKTLKSIIFVSISQGVLRRDVAGYGLEKDALWLNSITTAFYAKKIAQISKYKDPDTAFTAGLLKDMGKIIINQHVMECHKDIFEKVEKQQITFYDAEIDILGYSHAEIGARVAANWNFPEELVSSIRYHHKPAEYNGDNKEVKQLVYIVHLADIMTILAGSGIGADGMMYTLDMSTFEVLELNSNYNTVEELFSELIDLQPMIEEMTGLANAASEG
ncbi:MAG: HDOD domain-containing protein [Candidatus Gastranaerophilaceae bacterium]|jgi:putative nucleotidyltransferase with HDIG domain